MSFGATHAARQVGGHDWPPSEPVPVCEDCGSEDWEDWMLPDPVFRSFATATAWLCWPCFTKRAGWK